MFVSGSNPITCPLQEEHALSGTRKRKSSDQPEIFVKTSIFLPLRGEGVNYLQRREPLDRVQGKRRGPGMPGVKIFETNQNHVHLPLKIYVNK